MCPASPRKSVMKKMEKNRFVTDKTRGMQRVPTEVALIVIRRRETMQGDSVKAYIGKQCKE